MARQKILVTGALTISLFGEELLVVVEHGEEAVPTQHKALLTLQPNALRYRSTPRDSDLPKQFQGQPLRHPQAQATLYTEASSVKRFSSTPSQHIRIQPQLYPNISHDHTEYDQKTMSRSSERLRLSSMPEHLWDRRLQEMC